MISVDGFLAFHTDYSSLKVLRSAPIVAFNEDFLALPGPSCSSPSTDHTELSTENKSALMCLTPHLNSLGSQDIAMPGRFSIPSVELKIPSPLELLPPLPSYQLLCSSICSDSNVTYLGLFVQLSITSLTF